MRDLFAQLERESRLTSEYTLLGPHPPSPRRAHRRTLRSRRSRRNHGPALSWPVQRADHAGALRVVRARAVVAPRLHVRVSPGRVAAVSAGRLQALDRRRARRRSSTQLSDPSRIEQMKRAIPARWDTPGMDALPSFTQVDFAVVRENGTLVPKLIELQGFPSLTCLQVDAARRVARHDAHDGRPRSRMVVLVLRPRPRFVHRARETHDHRRPRSGRSDPDGHRSAEAENVSRLRRHEAADRRRCRRSARAHQTRQAALPRQHAHPPHLQPRRLR